MNTINGVLQQTMKFKHQLLLDLIVCTFEQAIYAKAIEFTWKHPEKYHGIIVRMGDFLIMCIFLSILRKRYQDAGLRDLWIETGTNASDSAAGILKGRH